VYNKCTYGQCLSKGRSFFQRNSKSGQPQNGRQDIGGIPVHRLDCGGQSQGQGMQGGFNVVLVAVCWASSSATNIGMYLAHRLCSVIRKHSIIMKCSNASVSVAVMLVGDCKGRHTTTSGNKHCCCEWSHFFQSLLIRCMVVGLLYRYFRWGQWTSWFARCDSTINFQLVSGKSMVPAYSTSTWYFLLIAGLSLDVVVMCGRSWLLDKKIRAISYFRRVRVNPDVLVRTQEPATARSANSNWQQQRQQQGAFRSTTTTSSYYGPVR